MTVDRAEVERMATLARLRLEDEEAARLTEEMNRILEHAIRLRRLAESGDGVEDSVELTGSGTRSDEAEKPDELLRPLRDFAPATVEGFVLVPPPPGVTHDNEASSPEPDLS